MILTSELKVDVARALEMAQDDATYTKFNVLSNINAAQSTILNSVPVNMLDTAVKTIKGDLVQAVNAYQWPSDYGRLVELRLDYATSITALNRGYEARVKDKPDSSSIFSTPRETDPVMCPAFEGGFEVFPVPIANVKEGYRLKYVQNLPVVTDVQNCLLNARLKNLVVFRACALCALTEGYDKKTAADFEAMYAAEKASLL